MQVNLTSLRFCVSSLQALLRRCCEFLCVTSSRLEQRHQSSSGAKMYRAIVQRGYNPEDPESTLEVVLKPIPTPAPGYVVVHITIRPVHPIDWLYIRTGHIANLPPATPGTEGFGIVKTIGEGVTRVKPGQRVVPQVWLPTDWGNGSWQEFVNVKEEWVIPIPDSISDEVAAQFLINPWTAIGMLQDQDIPKGEYLLQSAAGSVLGRQIIQLAKHFGFKTINIVRRPEQKEELLALGADEVICSKTEDIVARVEEITSGKLAYGGLDAVGGEITKAVVASVRDNGRVFRYAGLGSTDGIISILDMFRRVSVRAWSLYDKSNETEELSKQAIKVFEEQIVVPLLGEKFDLADFKKAIDKSENVGHGGKVFLTSPRSS